MIKSCASLRHFRTYLVTKGDAQPCPCSPISTNSSTRTHATPLAIRSDGKIAPCKVPGATVTTSSRGGRTPTDRGANDLSALSRLFVSASRERGGSPSPHQLSVGLVAAECRAVLRDASPTGRTGGRGWPIHY